MLLRLKRRADSFDNWATEVKRALDPSDPKVGESAENSIIKFFSSEFPQEFPFDLFFCSLLLLR